MKKFRKFIAVLVAVILAAALNMNPAFAKADSGVAASSLAAYLTVDGKTELLHDYTVSEMTNLIDGKNVKYSSIDAMPARVLTVGNGVYISTLISDLKKYSDADVSDFEKIKIFATDGWTRTFTKNDLIEAKYYYGNLFDTDTWDSTVGKAGTAAAEGGTAVKPMLAVTSWQGRVMENTKDVSSLIGEMTDETMFRFCFGMSPSDLTSGEFTTSEYGRWINKIELIMGNTEQGTSAPQSGFSDVNDQDWFSSAVQFVTRNNLFQGTGKNTFSPNEKMTRGMFVTALGRMAKADTAGYSNSFRDVAEGQYYKEYVAWASGSNLVSGYGDEFRPGDLITREQMALILFRYAKTKGVDVSNTDSAKCLAFSDYMETMDAAKEAVCWAVNSGIMAGGNGTLTPKGAATRAQVAQIMKNFSESTGAQ